jgi:hypothetical protein
MNELFIDYVGRMKALNESFVEASHKMNEESGELVKANGNVPSFYIAYLELFILSSRYGDYRDKGSTITLISGITINALNSTFIN